MSMTKLLVADMMQIIPSSGYSESSPQPLVSGMTPVYLPGSGPSVHLGETQPPGRNLGPITQQQYDILFNYQTRRNFNNITSDSTCKQDETYVSKHNITLNSTSMFKSMFLKCKFLYSAVYNPKNCSKHFMFYSLAELFNQT